MDSFPRHAIARSDGAWRRRAAARLVASAFALLLAGCACYGHKVHRPGELARIPVDGRDVLHVVEADDEGWFWEPARATAALAEIDSAAAQADTFVLVFAHGWHHSAACCDGNFEGFKDLLRDLRKELSKPMYSKARGALRTGTPGDTAPDFRIVGIYVGWRGGSLPGYADYATFWGRKSAAERVGATDLREFMQRLALRYDVQADRQVAAFTAGNPPPPFLGLVTIGHSFGGQVMLNAVSPLLESRLIEAAAPPAWLRATQAPAPAVEKKSLVRGFGDLVILVNPAVEAAAYQRIHALGRGLAYDPHQTPLVLTVSANDDKPRSRYFPPGRVAGEIFGRKPRKADPFERESERVALGFFKPQVTHTLVATDPSLRLAQKAWPGDPERHCVGRAAKHCTFDKYAWTSAPARTERDSLSAESDDPRNLCRIDHHDLSACTVFGNVVLRPRAPRQPYGAFLVAAAEPSVITTHNGMFSEPLTRFLVSYVGFIEAKRFMPLALPAGSCASQATGGEDARAAICESVD